MDFWRTDLGLFRTLVEEVPWEIVLKSKGVQEGWMLSQGHLNGIRTGHHLVLQDELSQQLQAMLQVLGRMVGKLHCRNGFGGISQQPAKHEPAVCPRGSPGLYQK